MTSHLANKIENVNTTPHFEQEVIPPENPFRFMVNSLTRETLIQKIQSYEAQIAEAKRRENEKMENRQQRAQRFQHLVSLVIRPTMEEFAKEVESGVCKFRVDGDYVQEEEPHVRFWIYPEGVNVHEYEFKDVPHLFYTLNTSSGLVSTNISTMIKNKNGRIYEGPCYKLDEINEQAVERDLVKVVNEVMDNILT
jgi:hypothetical protein